MDILTNWDNIRKHFRRSILSSLHVSIASIDFENNPTTTPIGSLFLNKDQTGFYFEKYPSKLPCHAEEDKNICVLAVNSSLWFWIKSLAKGRFKYYPAVKLYGLLGEKRKATQPELEKLKRQMRPFRFFKGHDYLWGNMEQVREITFTKAEKVNLGKMTQAL